MIILNVVIEQTSEKDTRITMLGSESQPTEIEGRVCAQLVNTMHTRVEASKLVKEAQDANGSSPVPQPQEAPAESTPNQN